MSNEHVLEGQSLSESNIKVKMDINNILLGKDGVKERLIVMDQVEERACMMRVHKD
jgi:hypothetical protein